MDKSAFKLIKQAFPPNYKVVPFTANWLAEHGGGVLNCGIWIITQ